MESEENLVSPTKFLDVKLLIRLLLILSFFIGCSDTVNSGPASISGGFEETPLVAVEIPDNAVDYTGQAEVVISIEDNVFHDRVITVSAGTNITWVNNGRNRHNVMPSLEEGESGWFLGLNEDLFDEAGSASLRFEQDGYFPYFCTFHGTATRGQTGQIFVITG